MDKIKKYLKEHEFAVNISYIIVGIVTIVWFMIRQYA